MKLIDDHSVSYGFEDNLQDLASFKILASIDKLQYVSCALTNLNDLGLAQICKFNEIENLNLQDTLITNSGIIHLLKLPKLKHLRLKECQEIDDHCVLTLNKLRQLETLSLNETKITEQGLKHLNIPSLKHLVLDFDNFSDKGLVLISKNNPKCDIVVKGHGTYTKREKW